MSVTAPNFQALEDALNDLGTAWVLIGDPFTVGGLDVLGLTPGDITPEMNPQIEERIYEEYARQPVSAKLVGYQPQVDIPLIWGDPTVYAKVQPTAAAAGGHSSPQDLVYSTLVLVPDSEFQSDWAYSTGAWTYPANGPKHAVWFPEGYFMGSFPTFGSMITQNKNRTGSVTFRGRLADDANWVEGTKSWIIGDPATHGVTGLAI